ncbi:hypothetical protein [Pedobacter cryotolerans]|uniref:Uncharacterized protein n=1 Tax=Pedobacter cryotolerans TaxID=2571270 RepID=A0A4U1BZU7_9SPHI|nr:hypothetical protein [Pedobacter cryotolerans]TKB96153.1 hypothetical protein FA045_18600 [Pedobacter cryotolerans]
MAIDEQYLNNEIEDFRGAFCPFGYLDIKRAVSEALEIGKDSSWAFEQMEAFAEDCDMKITDLDPCYVVMDAILQMARNEIEEMTGFDLQNDASFETMGNFCATTYDWQSEDIELLTDALSGNPDALENLSDATRYWLSQVEIDLDSLTGEQ